MVVVSIEILFGFYWNLSGYWVNILFILKQQKYVVDVKSDICLFVFGCEFICIIGSFLMLIFQVKILFESFWIVEMKKNCFV